PTGWPLALRRSSAPARDQSVLRGSVLQVVTSTERRGAETFGVALGEALAERGWANRTVALHPGYSPELQVGSLGEKALGRRSLARLRHAGIGADVTVAHGSSTLAACAIALAGTRARFVYRNIGDPWHWSARGVRRVRTRIFLTRAHSIVAL